MEEIVKTVDELERKVALGTQTAQDDLAFHEAVLHATHNPFVIKIGLTSMHLFGASINNSMLSIPDQAVYDHRRIVDAMILEGQGKIA